MKQIKIIIFAYFCGFIMAACSSNGNTGNGSMDTGVKEGSGYSDSLNTERGTLDTSTTPKENDKDHDYRH